MNIDITTLNDLSIFSNEEELSVFHRLDSLSRPCYQPVAQPVSRQSTSGLQSQQASIDNLALR